MNRYEPSTPRAALGLAAVAMAAVTLTALVVLPAELDSLSADPYMQSAAQGDNNGARRLTDAFEPSAAGLGRLRCAFLRENS
jgi:hypothetical protein